MPCKPSREELEATIAGLSAERDGMAFILRQKQKGLGPEVAETYEGTTFELWGSTRADGGYVNLREKAANGWPRVLRFEDWANTLIRKEFKSTWEIYISDIAGKFKAVQRNLFEASAGHDASCHSGGDPLLTCTCRIKQKGGSTK